MTSIYKKVSVKLSEWFVITFMWNLFIWLFAGAIKRNLHRDCDDRKKKDICHKTKKLLNETKKKQTKREKANI